MELEHVDHISWGVTCFFYTSSRLSDPRSYDSSSREIRTLSLSTSPVGKRIMPPTMICTQINTNEEYFGQSRRCGRNQCPPWCYCPNTIFLRSVSLHCGNTMSIERSCHIMSNDSTIGVISTVVPEEPSLKNNISRCDVDIKTFYGIWPTIAYLLSAQTLVEPSTLVLSSRWPCW